MTFNRSRDFEYAQKIIRLLTQGRALFSQMTLITFIVEPPKVHNEYANQGRGFQKYNCFDPLVAGHVIRRMRSSSVRIFNGNQRETL